MQKVPAISIGITAAALFGLATPLSKILLDQVNTFQLAGLLYLGAAFGLLPLLIARRQLRSIFRIDRRNGLKVGGAIVFGGILGPVFLLLGLRSAQASSVSLWLNLELVATALLGVLLFKDHLSASGWLSVGGVIAAGVLIAVPEGIAGVKSAIWVAAACCCWGVDNHLTAIIDGITPLQSTFLKGMLAGSFNLILGIVLNPAIPTFGPLLLSLCLGAVSYGASIVLYITAAQNLGATRSQLVFASAPFFGMMFSLIILSERLSILQMVAAAILVASIVLMSRIRHMHFHVHHAVEHIHFHTHDDEHHDHEHSKQVAGFAHSHRHKHERSSHSHPHVPDLHHRHEHQHDDSNPSN